MRPESIPFDRCDYDDELKIMEAVERIHASPKKACLIITGGGTEMIPMLLRNGDGSRTLTSAHVPYDERDLKSLLQINDHSSWKTVGKDMAEHMARTAWKNSFDKILDHENAIGLAITASLQRIEKEREGRRHQAYVSFTQFPTVHTYLLDLTPNQPISDYRARRRLEEALCAEAGLWALATACGVEPHRSNLPLVRCKEDGR